MLDIKIDELRLDIANAIGQEHRIQPIVEWAVALLAERLDAQTESTGQDSRRNGVRAQVAMDLPHMNDEAAARHLADALFDSLALKTQA